MNFEFLVKACVMESDREEAKNIAYLNNVLNKLIEYMNNEVKANPSLKMEDINKKIYDNVGIYLSEVSDNKVQSRAIEHYLGTNSYSDVQNIRKKYDEIIKAKKDKGLDIYNLNKNQFFYNHNMNHNFETLILSSIADIRRQKREFQSLEGFDDIVKDLENISAKERSNRIKRIAETLDTKQDKKKIIRDIERGYKLLNKPERELVEEHIKEYTQNASLLLKEECIKCIRANISFLDKFGLIGYYTDANNYTFKKICIGNANYTYEQVKDMFKEDSLKKLNVEQLIVLSSFWTNRVNKYIRDLNQALYIVNNRELLNEEKLEDGTVKYAITDRNVKNVELKMNIIHKLYFELFDQLEEKNGLKKGSINLKRYINGIAKKHGEKYKAYCDLLFPNSENSLKNDLMIASVFENARYNSYTIKRYNIEALLTCLFNSNNQNIVNFGYIEEGNVKKKEMLIGVDVKGLNMPFALHTKKESVINFLKENQGNVNFPIYKGYNDFYIGRDTLLKAQILVPLTKETDEAVKIAAEKITPRDRYSKTILHLNYLRKDGKMPEHMTETVIDKTIKKRKFVREYINLDTMKKEIEKER